MVFLWVLLMYYLEDDSRINHKLSYNTRCDGKLCSLYPVKNKPSFETTSFIIESHNWRKSRILIGQRSEVFSVEFGVENEA